MNLLDAAYLVVHDYKGGANSLAPRMGKSGTYLSAEVSATGTAKLGLLDAEKITNLTGDLRILEAFATNCGQMLVPLPMLDELQIDDCMLRLADSMKAAGDLCKEVASDLSDGSLNDNEMANIEAVTGKAIASMNLLVNSLTARHQAEKAARSAKGGL